MRSSQVAQNYKVYKSGPEGSTIWIAYESHYHSHVTQLMKSREQGRSPGKDRSGNRVLLETNANKELLESQTLKVEFEEEFF